MKTISYACILVSDDEEEVVAVLHKTCSVDELGEPNIQLSIKHPTGQFFLKRGLMKTVYVYGPAEVQDVDTLA